VWAAGGSSTIEEGVREDGWSGGNRLAKVAACGGRGDEAALVGRGWRRKAIRMTMEAATLGRKEEERQQGQDQGERTTIG
jgi:hypothetical protein